MEGPWQGTLVALGLRRAPASSQQERGGLHPCSQRASQPSHDLGDTGGPGPARSAFYQKQFSWSSLQLSGVLWEELGLPDKAVPLQAVKLFHAQLSILPFCSDPQPRVPRLAAPLSPTAPVL